MAEVKSLLISMLLAGAVLTSLVTVLNEGNVMVDKSFSEDFEGINQTSETLAEGQSVGSTIREQETQQSDLGIFSLQGAFTALKNLFNNIGLISSFADSALDILNAPPWFQIAIQGIVGLTITFIVLGIALGGRV